MTLHVIVGAGPVGSATAMRLAGQGEQVRIITRSGTGPAAPCIERIAADAGRLAALATGAAGILLIAVPGGLALALAGSTLTAAAGLATAVILTVSAVTGFRALARGTLGRDDSPRGTIEADGPVPDRPSALHGRPLTAGG